MQCKYAGEPRCHRRLVELPQRGVRGEPRWPRYIDLETDPHLQALSASLPRVIRPATAPMARYFHRANGTILINAEPDENYRCDIPQEP